MKTQTLLILGALAISAHARNCWSPDKSARLECNPSSIDLFDEQAKFMMPLIRDAGDAKEIEVSWAPDSQKVLVVESLARGSVIFGAYKDSSGWHKVIEPDSDMSHLASRGAVSETRKIKGWSDSSYATIGGQFRFRDGHVKPFQYTLYWKSGPGRIDRGGYEEGIISNEL